MSGPLARRGSRVAPLLLLGLGLPLACGRRAPSKDTLVILLPSDIMSVDPNERAEFFTDAVLFNVYEPLVGLDSNLSRRTVLADSWEHPSPERWRFHLRKGVRFHDGTPLTGAIVRDQFRALQEATREDGSNFLGQVAGIEAPDAETIELTTREPRNIVANVATTLLSKASAQAGFPPLVGTGPYRIREWTPGQRVVLERWDGYLGHPPAFRRIVFEPVADRAVRVKRLLDGSADIIYEAPPDLEGSPTPGARLVRRHGLTLTYLGFDTRSVTTNPLRDVRLRRAIHLALDREELVERVLRGDGVVAREPLPAAVYGYDGSLPLPKRDVTLARELLSQAGHPGGLSLRLDFAHPRKDAAELIRDQLKSVGITLELHSMDPNEFYDLVKAGGSRMFLVGWSFSSGEASEFYEFCLHTQTSRFGFNNYGQYSNPVLDKIAEENAAILDSLERRLMLEMGAGIVMQDLPVLPLYVEDDLYGIRDDIAFSPRADGEIDLRDLKRADR